MPLTPEERTNRARHAALTRWSRESPDQQTAKMRAGLMRKYEMQVDPEQLLSPAERKRRANAARRADLVKNAMKSARARATRKSPASDEG